MNPWQMAQQLKFLLGAVTWPGGSVVFGSRSVFVYAGAQPDDAAMPGAFPFALITIEAGKADPDDPDLIEQEFSILSVVNTSGDPLGEHAIIGASRANLGNSEGAGVAEIAERVRSAVQRLTGVDGAPLIVSGTTTQALATLGKGRHLVVDQFKLTALCTSQPFYTAPQQFKFAGSVCSWKGAACVARFDWGQYRIGWVPGDKPATSVDDITARGGFVATTTNSEVVASIVPGRTYSVVADYAPRGTGTVEGSSDPSTVGCYFST